ncbi:MAG: hypothetical protein GY861_17550 [bacterium]|nr:hypothetical protein [bacterium]
MDELSKFTDYYTTAGSLDSGDSTVDRIFAEAMIIAQPVAPLEEKGVIEIKDTGANTDKVVFTVIPESTFTWRTVDARGSEVVTAGSLQQISAPTFTEVTPTTKSATIFIFDNINLVNPVDFKKIAEIAGNQIKQKKITDGLTELTTAGNYTASTSIRNGNGFTTFGAVASDDTLVPNDLVSAKNDLKGQTSPIVPDVCIAHTKQLNQLENSADFSPGQSSNSNFKKAKFDADGHLAWFDGMEMIEALEAEMAQKTSGSFNSQNGHFAIIGKRDLMLGRGENNRKNTVEDFRNPEQHGVRRTLNVNFDYVIKFPDGIRLIACVD